MSDPLSQVLQRIREERTSLANILQLKNLTENEKDIAKIIEHYNYEKASDVERRRVRSEMKKYLDDFNLRKDFIEDLYEDGNFDRIRRIKRSINAARSAFRRKVGTSKAEYMTYDAVNADLIRHCKRASLDEHKKHWFYRLHPRYTLNEVSYRFDQIQKEIMYEDFYKLWTLLMEYYNNDRKECTKKITKMTEFLYLQSKHCRRIGRYLDIYLGQVDSNHIYNIRPLTTPKEDCCQKIYERVQRKYERNLWREKLIKRLFFMYGFEFSLRDITDYVDTFLESVSETASATSLATASATSSTDSESRSDPDDSGTIWEGKEKLCPDSSRSFSASSRPPSSSAAAASNSVIVIDSD